MSNSRFTEKHHHNRLERSRIICKGNVYLNREDGEQYELVDYMEEPSQMLVRNLNNPATKSQHINLKTSKRTGNGSFFRFNRYQCEYWEKENSIKGNLDSKLPLFNTI